MAHAAYTRSASTYDLIYSFKDYAAEVVKLTAILEQECPGAQELLDVACGTAEHARLLVETPTGGGSAAQAVTTFRVDGVDLEPSFLEIARVKVPSGRFVVGDMADFDLGRRYDAVLCLFSAIGSIEGNDAAIIAAGVMPRSGWRGHYYLGLLPAYRGRGRGVEVMLHGFRTMRAMGGRECHDGTDARNQAALSLFRRLGCAPQIVMEQWKLSV